MLNRRIDDDGIDDKESWLFINKTISCVLSHICLCLQFLNGCITRSGGMYCVVAHGVFSV